MWKCQCSCENNTILIVSQHSLKTGNTQSCGCLQREITKEKHKRSNIYDISGEYGILWSNNTNQEIYFDFHQSKKDFLAKVRLLHKNEMIWIKRFIV